MGEEGRANVGQMGLPALEPGKIVRIPLTDLHDFLERNGLEIVGRLSGPEARRLVVELAPVGTRGERAGGFFGAPAMLRHGAAPQNDRMQFSE